MLLKNNTTLSLNDELFILQLFILQSIHFWNLLEMLMHLIMLSFIYFNMRITLYWQMYVHKKHEIIDFISVWFHWIHKQS